MAFQGDFAYTGKERIFSFLLSSLSFSLFLGLNNGTIIRFNVADVEKSNSFRSEVVSTSFGRPLGLRFSPSNPDLLFVADAHLGVVSLNIKTRQTERVLSTFRGEPIKFADHLVISKDGEKMFLSDASSKYSVKDTLDDLWEGKPFGRIISFDLKTKEAKLVAENLYFANGVHLSQDEQTLFVAETFANRVSKVDLKTGKTSIFLSGTDLIDNISPGSEPGTFWLSGVSRNNPSIGFIFRSAFLRRLMRKLPPPATGYASGLLVTENGEILKKVSENEKCKYVF